MTYDGSEEHLRGETVRETIKRSMTELERKGSLRTSGGEPISHSGFDAAVLAVSELLFLLFGLPFGDALYHGKIEPKHLVFLGIALICAVSGPMWPAIKRNLISPDLAASVARTARDPRVWLAVLLLFFMYGFGPEIFRRTRTIPPDATPVRIDQTSVTAGSRRAVGSATILNPNRYYSAQNKDELSGRLDAIGAALNKSDDEFFVPANRALTQRFLVRPAQEAQTYLDFMDGIIAASKKMDSELYDGLLGRERDYRAELNAILFPKDPFVKFMAAADEYRNGISVWMRINNTLPDDQANHDFQRLVGSSARSFMAARDEFLKWVTERQDLIARTRRELRA